MATDDKIMCTIDGPEVAKFKAACKEHKIWGCFSIMELNPGGMPYNSGIIIDDTGELKLYYRKLHPWIPVEPWEPGNVGIPVCEGPKGCKLALIICHDGMFPEMSREAAYKGAEVMIRTAGYTAPIRSSWRFTNQANSFQNLMVTCNVCMCGSDGSFDSMGEGMIVNFDGEILSQGATGRVDEIIAAEVPPAPPEPALLSDLLTVSACVRAREQVRPDLVREARLGWGVENNIYQLGHRGCVLQSPTRGSDTRTPCVSVIYHPRCPSITTAACYHPYHYRYCNFPAATHPHSERVLRPGTRTPVQPHTLHNPTLAQPHTCTTPRALAWDETPRRSQLCGGQGRGDGLSLLLHEGPRRRQVQAAVGGGRQGCVSCPFDPWVLSTPCLLARPCDACCLASLPHTYTSLAGSR